MFIGKNLRSAVLDDTGVCGYPKCKGHRENFFPAVLESGLNDLGLGAS